LELTTLDDWLRCDEAEDAPIRGRKVFVRADLNVPLDGGRIVDDTRLRASAGSLKRLCAAGARVILASHLGRPGGERVPSLSLAPLAPALAQLTGLRVAFAEDCVGVSAHAAAQTLADGEVLLLENLRFHPGETKNDPDFAGALAQLADLYVNDAFGTAHRAHASTVGIVDHVSGAAAGDLLMAELRHLGAILEPQRPLLCLLGGAKVSDKLGVLQNLAERADVLAIGGAMAYTFLAARGDGVGNSLVEESRFDVARALLARAEAGQCRLLLPTDHVVSRSSDGQGEAQVVPSIPTGWMGVDIGPETARRYCEETRNARTILWNGPMGIFEVETFARGTEEVARAVADSKATTVIGGGDSLAAVAKLGIGARIDHLSTGGGASLEFVQGLKLPGVAALEHE
jgi:phosphoglycerate kinase